VSLRYYDVDGQPFLIPCSGLPSLGHTIRSACTHLNGLVDTDGWYRSNQNLSLQVRLHCNTNRRRRTIERRRVYLTPKNSIANAGLPRQDPLANDNERSLNQSVREGTRESVRVGRRPRRGKTSSGHVSPSACGVDSDWPILSRLIVIAPSTEI
jgi:hypothetical protein